MACSYYIQSDFCADRPYPNEKEFKRNPLMSLEEDIINIYPAAKVEFDCVKTDPLQNQLHYTFIMKNLRGTQFTFWIITTSNPNRWMFGWKHEGHLQSRSWHYIAKDIIGYYRTF